MFAVPVLSGGLRLCTRLARATAFCLLAGCATVQTADPRDPHEGFNRAMFAFNEGFDEAIGKPVATAYREVLPFQVRVRVRNFFANIQDVMIGVNNLLQGKPGAAADDWARFMINSTLGLAGLHDIASEAGLEKHNEDFGQTFAVWGMDEGPFFVWPFIGPNTLRDTLGFAADIAAAPLRWAIDDSTTMWMMAGLYLVSERAELLDVTTTLDEAAIDKYLQRRDAYFERRRYLIYDGNPPRPPREPRSDAAPRPGTFDVPTASKVRTVQVVPGDAL
ncbi:MAG: VacJ family lipoprotein [Burkholderiales bacterium]|nr:VacJ family lipoprotein [Burkholderiales bacterium]